MITDTACLYALRRCVEAPVPWSANHFPASMRHLPPLTRAKAIDIANALLEQGYDEGKAIRISIAQAKRWANTHVAGEEPDDRG